MKSRIIQDDYQIVLTLSAKEAAWLHSVTQNPPYGLPTQLETEEDATIRTDLFNATIPPDKRFESVKKNLESLDQD